MTSASKDENGISTLIAASKNDGTTIVRIQANASNHGLTIDDAHTGSDNGNNGGNAMRDENAVPVLIATSSADGKTPIEVYGDPVTGAILIDST